MPRILSHSSDIAKFLNGACPEWKLSQLVLAEKKLARIGITSLPQLLQVLSFDDGNGLTELLHVHEEKPFSERTLQALRSQADKPLSTTADKLLSSVAARSAVASAAAAQDHQQVVEDPAAVVEEDVDTRLARLQERLNKFRLEEVQALQSGRLADTVNAREEVKRLSLEIQRIKWAREKGYSTTRPAPALQLEPSAAAALAKSVPRVEPRERSMPNLDIAVEWFSVVCTKILIKREPDKQAKSWGLIEKGKYIQVLPSRIVDSSLQEWVELTPFELWRSCLQVLDDSYQEGRGYALIDGSKLGLGTLLRGPLSAGEWLPPDARDLEDYHLWHQGLPDSGGPPPTPRAVAVSKVPSARLGVPAVVDAVAPNLPAPRADAASEREARPAAPEASAAQAAASDGKILQRFEVLHRQIPVHTKPSSDSPVLSKKKNGDIVVVESGCTNGWMKLANELGWVCVDASQEPDIDHATKAARQKANLIRLARTGLGGVASRDPHVARAIISDAMVTLQVAMETPDDAKTKRDDLSYAIGLAQGCNVDEQLVLSAERRLCELQEEGAFGTYLRMARQRIAQAFEANSAVDLRTLLARLEGRTAAFDASAQEIAAVQEVMEEARLALSQVLKAQERAALHNDSTLARLQAAVATGDPQAIKVARDEAKAAGVPKKDIARAFALAQTS